MSHSKLRKKGESLYINKWNPKAKKFINTCSICGVQGYSPTIKDEGFISPSNDTKDFEHREIFNELISVYKPLALDHLGRCEDCARIMDNKQ